MAERYRLRNLKLRLPMPDAGGALFPQDARGRAVDRLSPFYSRLIADGDLIPVEDEPAPAPKKAKVKRAARKKPAPQPEPAAEEVSGAFAPLPEATEFEIEERVSEPLPPPEPTDDGGSFETRRQPEGDL